MEILNIYIQLFNSSIGSIPLKSSSYISVLFFIIDDATLKRTVIGSVNASIVEKGTLVFDLKQATKNFPYFYSNNKIINLEIRADRPSFAKFGLFGINTTGLAIESQYIELNENQLNYFKVDSSKIQSWDGFIVESTRKGITLGMCIGLAGEFPTLTKNLVYVEAVNSVQGSIFFNSTTQRSSDYIVGIIPIEKISAAPSKLRTDFASARMYALPKVQTQLKLYYANGDEMEDIITASDFQKDFFLGFQISAEGTSWNKNMFNVREGLDALNYLIGCISYSGAKEWTQIPDQIRSTILSLRNNESLFIHPNTPIAQSKNPQALLIHVLGIPNFKLSEKVTTLFWNNSCSPLPSNFFDNFNNGVTLCTDCKILIQKT